MILDSSKKETPCFHKPVSIQINSPLPQGDTQPVSRRSDVVLHNKSPPNLIFYLWFWIALKRKLPVSTDQFHFRLTVHHPRVSLGQCQDGLMLHYKIKALQKLAYCHKSSPWSSVRLPPEVALPLYWLSHYMSLWTAFPIIHCTDYTQM